jgi:hypothetical protein
VSTGRTITVGAIGSASTAAVDPLGTITPADAAWTCECWIGADDRWHVPTHEVAVRQARVADVPVVETRVRIPSGDAVQRVYGVAGAGDPIVVEVENQSPAPFALAIVVRGATRVVGDGARVSIDGAFVLASTRVPSRWARTVGSPVQIPVTSGRAEPGPFPGARDRAGRLEVAFLHPLPHRATLRLALFHGRGVATADVDALASAPSVVTGWQRILERGMQVQLPDARLDARVRAARAEILLRGQARRPDPLVTAALEDWGFDAEAETAWRRLGTRARRRARTRDEPSTWAAAGALTDDAQFLLAARRLLVHDRGERGDDGIELCPEYPDEWRGGSLEVRDAPVAGGPVSYALRWHGPRPALLWDLPPGRTARIPGIDRAWVSSATHGDVLLAGTEGAA